MVAAGCSAAAPTPGHPTDVARDAGVPTAAAAPAIRGERSWASCYDVALRLLDADSADTVEDGLTILRGFCAEGDARGCVELDTPAPLRAACERDALVDACDSLADLYLRGVAHCAFDTASAEELRRMVCVGHGGGEPCLRDPI